MNRSSYGSWYWENRDPKTLDLRDCCSAYPMVRWLGLRIFMFYEAMRSQKLKIGIFGLFIECSYATVDAVFPP